MSLWGQYIQERLGHLIIEDDFGFISYQFLDGDACFIEDMFVIPEMRQKGRGSALCMQLENVCKSAKIKSLRCSVWPEARNATESMKVILAYGFCLSHITDDLIYFSKELT